MRFPKSASCLGCPSRVLRRRPRRPPVGAAQAPSAVLWAEVARAPQHENPDGDEETEGDDQFHSILPSTDEDSGTVGAIVQYAARRLCHPRPRITPATFASSMSLAS